MKRFAKYLRIVYIYALPIFLIVLFTASCSLTQSSKEIDSGIESKGDKTVKVYKTIGDISLKIQLYYPEGHKPSDKRPAIVLFFGGGWKHGDIAQFKTHSQYLASRGMVAMCADYRVEEKHGATPFECVKDAKSAIRWVRINADRLGVDPERIAAGGGSAGGHIAATAGIIAGLEEDNEDLSVSSKPDALVLFNPVLDNGPDGYGYDRIKERYPEISPIHNIQSEVPPSIVFLGTSDKIAPVSTAEKFKRLVEKTGSRCDLIFYEGQPHGFFNLKKGGPKIYAETFYDMDLFLTSLGYLEGPPTIDIPKEDDI